MPPQQPKPPDLDEYGNPISTSTSGKPPDLDEYGNPVVAAPPSMWSPSVIGESLKRGLLEGVPELPEPGWNYPGAQRQDVIGDISRLSMIPVGGAVEVFNKAIRPLTAPGNLGLMALSIAQPESIPITSAVFGAQMATQLPEQARGAYQQAQQTGAFSPEAIGKYGELGLTGLFTGGALAGGAKYNVNKLPQGRPVTEQRWSTFGQEELPFPPPPPPPPPPRPMPPAPPGEPFLPFDKVGQELPIRPPIRPQVAEPIAQATPPVPTPAETFADITGPGGFNANLTSIEGVQAAFREGKISQQNALKLMNKIHKDELSKQAKPVEPVKPVEKVNPETGEIEEVFPLTTEAAPGTPPPPGVTEVTELMTTKQVKNIAELQRKLRVGFNKTKELWEAAKEQNGLVKGKDGYYDFPKTPQEGVVQDTATTGNQIGIPANRVTPEFLANAEARGYRAVGKSEGGEVLFEAKGKTIGDLTQIGEPLKSNKDVVTIPMGSADKTYMEQLRKDGYIFKGMNEKGEYFLERPKGGESDIMRVREGEWTEDTSQSRLTREHTELWNRNHGIEKVENIEPEVPRTGWELEREFAGPFAKPGQRPLEELLRREGQKSYNPETGMGGMDIPEGGLRDVIEIFRGTIANSTPQVAGKELLQNAIDATSGLPEGKVKISYNQESNRLKVEDNGPGLNLDKIWTDYLNLTGSGKRGGEKPTIGELGVGKIGYLTKGEWFDFRTVTREADGTLMEHKFRATPEDVIEHRVKITSNPVPEGTPTGVWTDMKIPEGQNWYELGGYLENLKKHSKLSVPVEIQRDINSVTFKNPVTGEPETYPYSQDVVPPQMGSHLEGAKFLAEGESPGAKFKISIPKDAMEVETNKIEAILVSRGMFQGVETIYLGKKVRVPDTLVVEVNPTVKGTSEHYPLTTPTREKLRPSTRYKVQDLINDTLVEGAAKAKELELERTFKQMVPSPGKKFIIVDPGGRFTPEEINAIATNKELTKVARVSQEFLDELTAEFQDLIPGKKIYSQGFLLDPETRGMNVRNPHGKNEHAIMTNPINILKSARTPAEAAESFVHVLMHEFTHMIAWEEGAGFTSAFATVYPRFSLRRQYNVAQRLERILTAGSGQYPLEVSEILSRGREAFRRESSKESTLIAEEGSRVPEREGLPGVRGNVESGGNKALGDYPIGGTIVIPPKQATPANIKRLMDHGFQFLDENENGQLRFRKTQAKVETPILEEEVGGVRPTSREAKIQQLGPIQDKAKSSAVMEAFNLPRGIMASTDMSAPLRQGLPLIHKKAFWTSMAPLMRSWASEEGFVAAQNNIAKRALFKRRVDPITGKELPSFAEDAGLKLTDLADLSNREEAIMSTWAESGGMFERNKWMAEHGGKQAASAYRATIGGLVRRSNRAYTAFLNTLRADVFESLIKDGKILADVQKNLPLAREIAEFVNTATGRGSLGKLEKSATALNTALFAPRLVASRVKMLNPAYYIMASPLVRKEALKSLFAVAGFGNTVLQLAKMAGAEVGNDPNSADFGKAIIGNVRVDPWAGFQQYVVAANRLLRPGFAKIPGMEGGTSTGIAPLDLATGFLGAGGQSVTSSTTGRQFDLWKAKKGPYHPTHASIAGRFLRGKMNPVVGFGWSLADSAKEMSGQPMNFSTPNPYENAIMQRFLPILTQDIYELAKEDPRLLPLAIPAWFGMGVQTYGSIKQ